MQTTTFFRSAANLSFFGAFLFIVYGASIRHPAAGIVDHFKVGDVVHSILIPDDFRRLHGSGWQLMAGQIIDPTTDLRKLFPSQLIDKVSLPDARGVFLRGMNESRSTAQGDAEGNRLIGTPQGDVVGSHSHTSVMRVYYTNWTNGPVPAIEAQEPIPSQGRNPISIGPNGNPETRPRNIAIYVYIKVNEEK